jgi:hypothetical protein
MQWATESLISVLLTLAYTLTLAVDAECPCAWRKATLQQLYDTTNGPRWIDPWVRDDPEAPCSYRGVDCRNGDIVGLHVGARNLQGPFPGFLTQLGNLSSLQLQNNGLTGTLPAGDMGGWKISMKTMNIETLSIVSSLPESWSQMTALSWLSMRNNPTLTGPLPSSYSSWRPNWVDGGQCGFTGRLPESWGAWGSSVALFSFDGNRLAGGGIPDAYSNWVNIDTFQLRGNRQLGGTLPDSLAAWTKIVSFEVSLCGINGTIPPQYAEWVRLAYFLVDNNALSGTLPTALAQWKNISLFHLQGNQLNSTLPHEYSLWGVSTNEFLVNSNRMYGTIPPSYANWTNLHLFECLDNNITGTLPEVFSAWGSSFTALRVARNLLNGTLPKSFSNWTSLEVFEIDSNRFTGSFPPDYAHWNKSMTEFYASYNGLEGSLPPSYAAFVLLERLFVYHNRLNGTLPPSYSAWRSLQRVMISNNRFSGSLPGAYAQWGMSVNLVYMSNNSLSGDLPASWAALKNISELLLDFNQFTGTIPAAWTTMTKLGTVMLNNNKLTGTIPANIGNLVNMQLLLLNHNDLQGTLPPTVRWTAMFLVSLQHNTNLRGSIPLSWVAGFLQYPRWIAVCATRLCGSALLLGAVLPCFPSVQLLDPTSPDVGDHFSQLLLTSPSLLAAPCGGAGTSTRTTTRPIVVRDTTVLLPPGVPAGASATATAVNMACVFTGGCSASGFAVVQSAAAAARLAYRCAAAQYAEDNDDGGAPAAVLGAADSPTQLTVESLGETAGPAAGTMIGNTAIVVAGGALMHVVELVRRRVVQGGDGLPRGAGARALASILDLLGHDLLPGSSAGLFVMFLQPTLSACVAVLSADDVGVGVRVALALPCVVLWAGAIALVGYVVHARVGGAVPFVVAASRRNGGGGGPRPSRRHSSACVDGVARRVQAVRRVAWEPLGAWEWRRGDAASRWYACHFGAFFRMYSARRRTYVAVDCGFIALCGLVAGAAEATGASAAAACVAMQWGAGGLAALTAVVVCLFVYLRPMLTRIDTVSYVALGVLAVASEVAAAAGDATTSNGLAVTALSLQFALILANLFVGMTWRSSGVEERANLPVSETLLNLSSSKKHSERLTTVARTTLKTPARNAEAAERPLWGHLTTISQNDQLSRLIELAVKEATKRKAAGR